MKPSHSQLMLFLVLVFCSVGIDLGWAQSPKGTGQSTLSDGSITATPEVEKILFRHVLQTYFADSTLGPPPQFVFLTMRAGSASQSTKPLPGVVASLADLHVAILDEAEFSWSDSLGEWQHRSTKRLGYKCYVDIVKWFSPNVLVAEVGFHCGEDCGQAHKVRIQKATTGWTIKRVFDFKVY
jgi:hypothetical protein